MKKPIHRSSLVLVVCVLAVTLFACGANSTGPEQAASVDSTTTTVPPAPQNGPQVIHMEDGGRMEGTLREGARNGTWTSYFADGTIRSRVVYVNGVEEGPTEVFHSNGMPYYTGQYANGRTVGEWVFSDPTGAELKRVQYDSTGLLVK